MAGNTTVLLAAAGATTIIISVAIGEERRIWTRDWLMMRSSDRGIQSFVTNELSGQDASGFQFLAGAFSEPEMWVQLKGFIVRNVENSCY